jgi:hypothetical protein
MTSQVFNTLIDRVAADDAYLRRTLAPAARHDDFTVRPRPRACHACAAPCSGAPPDSLSGADLPATEHAVQGHQQGACAVGGWVLSHAKGRRAL